MDRLFDLMKPFPKLIILFWIILTIICSFWALSLTNYTKFEFEPPNGYDSSIAYDKMEQYFRESVTANSLLILIQKYDENQPSIINTETNSIYDEIKDKLLNHINAEYGHPIKSISSYYDFNDITKNKFIDKKEEIMLISVIIDTEHLSSMKLNDFIADINNALDDTSKKHEKYKIALSGTAAMFHEMLNIIKRDITGKDLYVLPIIFCFMIYVLGSWKLIIIPICSLIMSIIISFTFFLPFAKYKILTVAPLTPITMLFVIMALSVDYSLFLLSRYSSQIKSGSNTKHAVKEMLHFSGQVVILSAFILILCYLGLCLFPVVGLNTVGIGTSFGILFCSAINITFSCCMILAFPTFYNNLEILPSIITNCFQSLYDKYYLGHTNDRSSYRITHNNDDGNTSFDTDDCVENIDSDTSVDGDDEKIEIEQQEVDKQVIECRKNIYFKMAQFTTSKPYNYIFLIILYSILITIIIIGFLNYKASLDDTMEFSSDAKSVNAYNTIIDHFNPGILNPMTILAVNNDGNNIWNKQYFQHSCDLGNELINKLQYESTDLTSIAFIPSIDKNGDKILFCNDENMNLWKETMESGIITQEIQNKYPQLTPQTFEYFMIYFNKSVSRENNGNYGKSSIIRIEPNFNPYTGVIDAKSLKKVIESANEIHHDTDFYINNVIYWKLDTLTYLYSRIPWVLSIIIIVIFGLVGIVYKAYLLPFRLLICIAIPILFVYGLTSLIYLQKGIYFITPPMTMTVLIGLALDYEIFLFSRIYEYRKKQYTTKASIILGVAMTGPIITSAGTVMALAFSGLLIQPITAINQTGFIFVFGVICDAFIIRPCIVPSLLSIGGETINWWPTIMPTDHLKDEYGEYIN